MVSSQHPQQTTDNTSSAATDHPTSGSMGEGSRGDVIREGSSAGGRSPVSTEEIQKVQNLIERCMQQYMPQNQVVSMLQQQANIEPEFTQIVWQKLEEQNPEFFRMYHVRLKLKDQIVMFNYLLEQQVGMVQKLYTSWIQSLPPPMVPPGISGCLPAGSAATGGGFPGGLGATAPRPPGPLPPPGMPPFPFPPGMMLPPPGMMPHPSHGMMMPPPPGMMPPLPPPGMLGPGPGGSAGGGVPIPGMMMPMAAAGYPQMSFPPMPPLGLMQGGPAAFGSAAGTFGLAVNVAGVGSGGSGSKRASRTGMEGLDSPVRNGIDSGNLIIGHGVGGVDDLIESLGGLGHPVGSAGGMAGEVRGRVGSGNMMGMHKNFSFSDLSNFDLTTIADGLDFGASGHHDDNGPVLILPEHHASIQEVSLEAGKTPKGGAKAQGTAGGEAAAIAGGRSDAGSLLAESLLGGTSDLFHHSDHSLGGSGVTPSMFRGGGGSGGSVGAGLHHMGIDMEGLGGLGGSGEGSGQNAMNRNFSLGELSALDFDTPIGFNSGGR